MKSPALLLLLLVLATAAYAARPAHIATWGGKIAVGPDSTQISGVAQIDDSGSVKGQAEFHVVVGPDTTEFHVVVDCLTVVGNQAWIGGVISHSSTDPGLAGQRTVWTVIDNGEPGIGVDQGSIPVPGDARACGTQPALALLPWAAGNVQVR